MDSPFTRLNRARPRRRLVGQITASRVAMSAAKQWFYLSDLLKSHPSETIGFCY